MESARVCPTPWEAPERRRIQWRQKLKACLLSIDQGISSDARGEARLQELKQEWNRVNPTLPSRGAALQQQLYRMQKEAEKGDQDGDNHPAEPGELLRLGMWVIAESCAQGAKYRHVSDSRITCPRALGMYVITELHASIAGRASKYRHVGDSRTTCPNDQVSL